MVKRILDLAQLKNKEKKMADLKYFNALINSVVGNDEERKAAKEYEEKQEQGKQQGQGQGKGFP